MQIVIGVTGSIAAYKACELVRLFVKGGCDVRVVMTDAAQKFVTAAVFPDPVTPQKASGSFRFQGTLSSQSAF